MTATIDPDKIDRRVYFAVGGAILGTFMALLDMSVTNSSLPQIQGEIGATGTEGTWIGTSYLVSEIIMIPMTAWFSRLFGLRNFLTVAALLFAMFSALCGLSESLTGMIIGRVGQGFAGGALIPSSLTIISTKLAPKHQQTGLAVYSTVAVLAPVLGPILGGWLTENASWRWIFLMNLPIAIVLMGLLMVGLERQLPHWSEFGKADWVGILGLAAFLGGLTIVLEEGQRENWFDSTTIQRLSIASVIGFLMLMFAQFTRIHPIVKLKLLLNRSFGAVFLLMLVIGANTFTLLYLVPVFLGTIAHYNAQQTGFVAMYIGVATLVMVPVTGLLLKFMDMRLVVGIGVLCEAFGCLGNLNLTSNSVGADFILVQLLVGAGSALTNFPLAGAATAGIKLIDVPDATALFTTARNVGGSLGLAACGALIDRRLSLHSAHLHEVTSGNSPAGQGRVTELAMGLMREGADFQYARLRAFKAFAGEIVRQATVMSYIDALTIMGWGMLILTPVVLMLKPVQNPSAVTAH